MLGAASFRVQWKSVNANRSWPEHVDSCRFYWFRLRHAPQLKYPKLNDKSVEQTQSPAFGTLDIIFGATERESESFSCVKFDKIQAFALCVYLTFQPASNVS